MTFSSPEYQPGHRPPPHDSSYASSPSYTAYPRQESQAHPEFERHQVRLDRPQGRHSDLGLLRGAYRWQRRVATFTALGYFTLFLLLSAFTPSLTTATVSGGLTTGLLLGLIQVPVTCLAIGLYEYTARRSVDPIADRIRRQSAQGTGREAVR
ncbi:MULTISPECIES: DUF485 domain-containing protein [Streptomyces]|uniref:DUF485 domain-containing protein n=1 Tax=Streptomyces TaxID=1883 RepID=UPI003CE7970E